MTVCTCSALSTGCSTLLKSDQWHGEWQETSAAVRGVINFRQVPGTQIYCLGQPTLDALDEILRRVKVHAEPGSEHVVWVTLREEPLVYVNGAPFCLRRESFSLRNMKVRLAKVCCHRLLKV